MVAMKGPWRLAFEDLVRDKTAMVGAGVVAILCGLAVAAPIIAPHDPVKQNLLLALQPPSFEYPMGTDAFGRDVLSRLLHGAGLSLSIGFISVAIAVAAGLPVGLAAGYYGGRLEEIVLRAMDVVLAFPGLLLILVVVAILGTGLINAMIAVGIASIPIYVRIVRASTLTVMKEDYIIASRSIGCSPLRIMRAHLLPNILSPLLVISALRIGTAILTGATLGFLGLGAQPPHPEWGVMLAEATAHVRNAWWLATFPGIAILLAVLGTNLLGDGLRDALDPKLRTSG